MPPIYPMLAADLASSSTGVPGATNSTTSEEGGAYMANPKDLPVSASVGDGQAVTAIQLRRALVVLLREGESACSQAAFDLGANQCADDDLNDLATGLHALADAVRQYCHMGAM